MSSMARWHLFGGVLAIGLAVISATTLITWLGAGAAPELHGQALSGRPAAELGLVSAGGRRVSLDDLRGKVVLVYFGYTFCPDVCPTTLSDLRNVMRALGSLADDAQVLMVSVDPERDTPDRVDEYVKRFDPRFIGLSGSAAEVAAAAAAWAQPGDTAARLYLTANCGFWTAVTGLVPTAARDAAAYLSYHVREDGELPSFLQAHWLSAALCISPSTPGDVCSRLTICESTPSSTWASTISCFWNSARVMDAANSRALWKRSSGPLRARASRWLRARAARRGRTCSAVPPHPRARRREAPDLRPRRAAGARSRARGTRHPANRCRCADPLFRRAPARVTCTRSCP